MVYTKEFDELKAELEEVDGNARMVLRALICDAPVPQLIDEKHMTALEGRLQDLSQRLNIKKSAPFLQFYSRAYPALDGPELFYCKLRANLSDCRFWLTDNSALAEDYAKTPPSA